MTRQATEGTSGRSSTRGESGPETRNLIGGEWCESARGRTFAVRNPATDETLAEVPDCGPEETRRALDAAEAALPGWRARPAGERAAILRRWAELLLRDRERLARLMTSEQGKPLNEARGEIGYAASFFEWFAEEARRVYGSIVPASAADKRLLVLARPLGVCAAITPWNFPAAMIARKTGAALAAGCTQVVKPAEQTPLSAIAMAELAIEAGVPAGVFNVVTGAPEPIADAIFAHPSLRKVSFTGSTEVGQILMRKAADNVVRLSLELGGHAPLVVFADADLERAVQGAIVSKFRNAGQTCICANRILVEASVRERFARLLADASSKLVVGDGADDSVQIGPLIDDRAVEKALRHIDDARTRGAKVLCGGGRRRIAGKSDRFVEPTVLDGATPEMLCCREETFGPVAPILSFRDEAHALELANATPFGLAAYFFTRDAGRVMRFSEGLEFGIIGVNDPLPATAQAPFGGVKHSGFGREGGREGIEEYVSRQYVSWGQ